jgi:hypothetical protein
MIFRTRADRLLLGRLVQDGIDLAQRKTGDLDVVELQVIARMSRSQLESSAILLSAMMRAFFSASDSELSATTGTSCMPNDFAACSRPWPAITSKSSVTRMGLVKPNRLIEFSISLSCLRECDRALPG